MKKKALLFIFAILFGGSVLFGKGVEIKSEDNSVSINSTFFISHGVSMTIPGNFEIRDSLLFQNSGNLIFNNTFDSQILLPSGDLGLGEFVFTGSSNYELSIAEGQLHIGILKLNLQGSTVNLYGKLAITENMELSSGILNVTENSKLLIDNSSTESVLFTNSPLNQSYVIGFMSRKIEAAKNYVFPVGDISGFHPFLIDNPETEDVIRVEFDKRVPAECAMKSSSPRFLIENSLGWRVESNSTKRNNFYSGLSVLNSVLEGKTSQFDIFHISENESVGTVIPVNNNYEKSSVDHSFLVGSEKKSYGLLAFSQIYGTELINFIYVGSDNQTTFEIPDEGDFSNIRFYVYNQLGALVFKGDHYIKEFDARNYADGTYFYELTLEKDNKRSIIRNFIEIKHEK